jgi:micrococcal nuclease
VAKRKRSKRWILIADFIGLIALCLFILILNNGRLPWLDDLRYVFGLASVDGLVGPVELVRVSDGDTLRIVFDGQEESIRLIGIDTPETYASDKLERDDANSPLTREEIQALGRKASSVTKNFVEGKNLYLEFDTEERDRYKRLLVYVYYPDPKGDFRFDNKPFSQLNLDLVEAGWAQPLTVLPNVRYADVYVAASNIARAQDKGMWGEME